MSHRKNNILANTSATQWPSSNVSFMSGDKVVKQGPKGDLTFGEVMNSDDGNAYIVWDEGTPTNLKDLQTNSNSTPEVGIYDRTVTVGTRVRHLGKEGRVFSTNRTITAYLTGYEEIVIFPNLKEYMLYPALECKVGDTVMREGWIGLVTKGQVNVTYQYETGMTLVVNQDLESIQEFNYPGKKFAQLCNDLIQRGKWLKGMGWLNRLNYRNQPAKILHMKITDLSVFWFDRLKITADNSQKPQAEISSKKDLAGVFSLENPSMDKFYKDAVFILRWDDSLYENFQNWQEHMVNKYIRKEEGIGDTEPFFKRSKKTFPFTNRDRVAVKVLFCQTEADILFENGSTMTTMTHKISEILPHPFASDRLPFPDKNYMLGDVVKDKMEFLHPEKYGFVLSQNYHRRTLQIKWISVQRNKSVISETKETSLYDIQPYYKYQLLKNKPQIVVAKGIFEGVIRDLSLSEGKVKVQCAEGPVKEFWAHELDFCTKKVYISPVDKTHTIGYLPLPQELILSPRYCTKNSGSAVLQNHPLRPKVVTTIDVPWDHSFFNHKESKFDQKVQTQLVEDIFNAANLMGSVWIEKYAGRVDLITVVLVGQNDTIYKSVPFFLDFLIPPNYPRCLPLVVFRLPRIYDPGWIHPCIDHECRLTLLEEVDLSEDKEGGGLLFIILKHIQNTVLCKEPYLESRGLSSFLPENGSNNNNNNDNNNGQVDDEVIYELKKSRDFNEVGIVAVAEYLHALLCQPPSTWIEFVESHFFEYLSKICWRYVQYLEDFEECPNDTLLSINDRADSPFLLHPTSYSFKLALKSRLDHLNPFLEV